MQEEGTAAREITNAADSMRLQTDQTARAMTEQARAVKNMADGARSVSNQIGLISRANRDHSNTAIAILGGLTEIRQVTEQNVAGVKDTLRNTGSLLERVQSLNNLMEGLQTANGRGGKKAKKKK